ncbi:MAG: hypothetical protein KAJ19_28825 [Gammaproteobacteria bacterium]|nr:hypothetical protein [Gammaproteobacteria bacterium]
MSMPEEDLVQALQTALGGGPASAEGLDYARAVLQRERPTLDTDALTGLQEQETEVMGALRKAQERLQQMKGPTRAEKLLAIGAGLGAPTRTGAIGETAAAVSRNLAPLAAEQRAFESEQMAGMSQLDLAMAKAKGPLSQAEMDISQLQYEQEWKERIQAMKTVARGAGGSRAAAMREAKINDLITLWPEHMDRRNAFALVDGHTRIEISDETGDARLINEIDDSVTIIPLEMAKALEEYVPEYEGPTGGSTVAEGEIDTRTQPERDAGLYVDQAFRSGASVWDMAALGSGPVPVALAALSIPSSIVGGPVAEETLIAQQGLKLRSMTLAQQLVDNPRMPVRLVEIAMNAAGIEPDFFQTGPIMQQNLISLDQFLYAKYLEYQKYATNPGPKDLVEAGKINSQALGLFLRDLGVPPELRRRDLFVAIDGPASESGELPELDVAPPTGITQKAWDQMTREAKHRILQIDKDIKAGGEPD